MQCGNCVQSIQSNRLLSSVQSRRLTVRIAAKKGFGDGNASGNKDAAQIKVSKRGKVASRPSQQKQLERLQAEEQAYQAAFKAKLAAREAAANPSASTSALVDDFEDDSQTTATIPENITDRMLKRMLMFSIGPVFLGFTLFPLFYYLKKVQEIDVPVWVVYIVQTTIFAGGLLGISYGVLSASWTAREGSFWGWNEFQANLPLVMERFKKKDD